MKRQISSAKMTNRSYQSKCNEFSNSPYEKNYRGCLKADQRDLIFEHQRVSKLTRRDLEDNYINLCDDHFALKRENHANQEKIKRLITKLLRLTSSSLSEFRSNLGSVPLNKSRESLSMEEKMQICVFELEIQNAQLIDKLRTLSKKFGFPLQSRPVSEALTHFPDHHRHSCTRSRLQILHSLTKSFESNLNNTEKHKEKEEGQTEVDTNKLPPENPVPNEQEIVDGLKERILELERNITLKNEEFESEKRRMGYQIKELEIRKHISENIELITAKERLEECRKEFKRRIIVTEKEKDEALTALAEAKTKIEEANKSLALESENSSRLLKLTRDLELARNNTEELRSQLVEAELDRQSLRTQQERFSLILKESATQNERTHALKEKISSLQSKLDEAKSNEIAVLHSTSELVDKIIHLQDENDKIFIELEGFRSRSKFLNEENEFLTEKISRINLLDNRRQGNTKQSPLKTGQRVGCGKEQSQSDHNQNDTLIEYLKETQSSRDQEKVTSTLDPVVSLDQSIRSRTSDEEKEQDNSARSDHSLSAVNCVGNSSCTADDDQRSVSYGHDFGKRLRECARGKLVVTNHLELLEKASLYRPYLKSHSVQDGSSSTGNDFLPDSENSISESLLFTAEIPEALERNFSFNLELSSFDFKEQSAEEDDFYQIEFSVTKWLVFWTKPTRISSNKLRLRFNETILVDQETKSKMFNAGNNPSIQFMLLRRLCKGNPEPTLSSSSNLNDRATKNASSISSQCQEIAFATLKFNTALNNNLEREGDKSKDLFKVDLPFSSTSFPHNEIGSLHLGINIDCLAECP